jgi:hypothetical protein
MGKTWSAELAVHSGVSADGFSLLIEDAVSGLDYQLRIPKVTHLRNIPSQKCILFT